jgi:hypothetical protein
MLNFWYRVTNCEDHYDVEDHVEESKAVSRGRLGRNPGSRQHRQCGAWHVGLFVERERWVCREQRKRRVREQQWKRGECFDYFDQRR